MSPRHAVLFVRARSAREVTAPRLQLLRAVAAQRGWSIAREFVASPIRRGEREALVAAIHSGAHGSGVVIATSLVDVASTVRDAVIVLNDALGRGWDLVATSDAIDTTEASIRLQITGLIAGLAALDREATVERGRAALDRARRREGRQLGRKRREVPVQDVQHMLEAGASWREISRHLGIPASTLHAAFKRSPPPVAPDLAVLEAA